MAAACALRQSSQAPSHAEAARAKSDTRGARTRHLIELGGLLRKAGLVELTEDDRATQLQGTSDESLDHLRTRCYGLRAFDADSEAEGQKGTAGRAPRSRSWPPSGRWVPRTGQVVVRCA